MILFDQGNLSKKLNLDQPGRKISATRWASGASPRPRTPPLFSTPCLSLDFLDLYVGYE